MLRDFPNSLQRYRETLFIPSRPSGSPMSWAANYHQHYVSQESLQHEAAAPHWPAHSPSTHWYCQLATQYKQSVVLSSLLCLWSLFFFFRCDSQTQSPATARHANTNSGQHVDGKKSGQNQRSSIVLPVYLTEDKLTLAVLSLLLGGWLVVVVTFPIVSCCLVCQNPLQLLQFLY